MATTRLGSSGFGVKPYGSFAGRTAVIVVEPITRLGSAGFGVRRYDSFAGRIEVVPDSSDFDYLWYARKRSRR